MYKIYEKKSYLICVFKNVSEEDIQSNKYGEIIDKIWDNYKENNPNHVGFKLKKNNKTFYAFKE